MIPIRIVAICENGHIEDFPFREWIGCTCSDEHVSQLYFKAGRSAASLAGIKIECSVCNKRRSLAGSFDESALSNIPFQCSGAQPWLGKENGTHSCSCSLQTVQRGASNVYFPAVQSSIYIPSAKGIESDEVRRVLDNPNTWMVISSQITDGKVSDPICRAFAMQAGLEVRALTSAAQARIDAAGGVFAGVTDEDYRRQEYNVLSSGTGTALDELFVEQVDPFEFDWLYNYIDRVGLVRKLRETRVLTGFSRLMPKTDRDDPAVQPIRLNESVNWLPAVDVRGEGIFVNISDDRLRKWSIQPSVKQRVDGVIGEYNRRRVSRGLASRNLDARFFMLHTLAHCLIKELTFTCGYGSASLRERLYCNLENPDEKMNGILIYTASGDSEGTLGGLVAQAVPGKLELLFQNAITRNAWCSNDPVCIESPSGSAASSNLAACHGCVLLPETSCEEGNRLLDRALLVGTVGDSQSGFFSDRLISM